MVFFKVTAYLKIDAMQLKTTKFDAVAIAEVQIYFSLY